MGTVFLVAAAAQLFFWWRYLLSGFYVSKSPRRSEAEISPSVSVIVCFHNEVSTLEGCLTGILAQEYGGAFELLAVDDNSTDGSAEMVLRLIDLHGPQLRLLQPGPTRPGKKDALTYGVHHANHDILLLTDADCVPASTTWLDRMTLPFVRGQDVVLGVGQYAYSGSAALQRFQRYEAMYVALKYLGFAARNQPYMGVGRNLAYRKSFFLNAGGLEAHADLAGGDDDLLIGHHAAAGRTARVTWPMARTISQPSPGWRDFLRQRQRHQSTGTRYRPVVQALLGGIALSHGLFFLLGFCLLFSSWWWLALIAYAVRFVLVVLGIRSTRLKGAAAGAEEVEQQGTIPVWEIILWDAMLAPFYLYLAVSGWLPGRQW